MFKSSELVVKDILVLMLAFILLSSFIFSARADNELEFGSVAMDIPAVMHERLSPLTRYLSQSLNRKVSLKLSPNMGGAIKEVASGKVDIAYLTPVAYLKAHEQGGARLVAKTVTNGKASFQLMIVVKEDSPIRDVNDLVGKSFAFGDKRALLQRATVVDAGLALEQFSEYRFLGHYDNIARSVANGDFTAGILKDTMAFKWQYKGLRILHQSPSLPPYNITVAKHVDDETLGELRRLFLALDKTNPEHLHIIKALDKKYDGFAATDDSEYNVVRKMIKPFVVNAN